MFAFGMAIIVENDKRYGSYEPHELDAMTR